jgi:hypothetical protein
MFGHKNLLGDGAQASAIVLDSQDYGLRGDAGGYTGSHIELEVHFTDGTTARVSCKAKIADVGIVIPGQIVPVRYDEGDRTKVEIDGPAMTAQRAAKTEAARAASVARAQAHLAHSTEPGDLAAVLRRLQAAETLPTVDETTPAREDQ